MHSKVFTVGIPSNVFLALIHVSYLYAAYMLANPWLIKCSFTEPQPSYSAFREASFGHAILDIRNRTHAYYTWHRNQDSEPVAADSIWLYNRYYFPQEEKTGASTMV